MSQPIIFGSVILYSGLLFAIAYWADQRKNIGLLKNNYAVLYGLSIAIYCTSWTFYGAVGTAQTSGWEYLPIYLGPALIFSVGRPLIARMVETGKRIHSTSIADFISAHYERSRPLAALVTIIAVIGALPYIGLQLKSVATTFDYLSTSAAGISAANTTNRIFLVAIILAVFSIMFGTRHIDITRHNGGMIAAIAFDSIVKLVALLAVGLFAMTLASGNTASAGTDLHPVFSAPLAADRFIILTLLSMAAVLCLPRQFHVTIVECQNENAVRPASLLFLGYLAIISLLVIPIANGGAAAAALDGVPPDLTVLALPLANGAEPLALLVFVGGFAAATGMVIVASVALSTMITNDLIAPFMLQKNALGSANSDFGPKLLAIRRISIAAILLSAAIFAAYAPQGEQLASFGILSFAAAAQFTPALIGALYWRRAQLAGAITGMSAGFALWLLLLFAPSYFGADVFGISDLLSWLDFTGWDSLTHGVTVSLFVNATLFCTVSVATTHTSRSIDARLQSSDIRKTQDADASYIRAGDLYMLIRRCLGERQAVEMIQDFEDTRGMRADVARIADPALISFADQQISKAIGASSASILLRSVLAGGSLQLDDVATLLGETTGKVKFNQDLLQTTLENISNGVSVVDRDLKLVAWNAAYERLYQYPPGLIQEGRPIADLIRHNAEKGECGPGAVEKHIEKRLSHLRSGRRHSYERTRPDGSVIKIEGVRSPSGAYVTTFTDVSEYKRIQKALIDSERSIRFYTDNIPSMVAFSDSEERLRFANNAYRSKFDVNETNIDQLHLKDLMTPAEYLERKPYIEKALRGEKATFDIDLNIDDTVRHMQVEYVPQFRNDGTVRGFFGLYQDVTARQKAEQALAETNETLEQRVLERTRELSDLNAALDGARYQAEQATASKTRFLAAASHDVLQPLNAARLFTSTLKDSIGANNEAAALTEKIDASISSADRLLRALLDISKLDAGGIRPEFSSFALADLFEELTNDFAVSAAKKGLAFQCVKTNLWIRSDRGLLRSALQNLVANAVRYTDSGKVLIGARRMGGEVRIEVRDTGRGIPRSRHKEIFQEFKRLNRDFDVGGAGLGLATVDRISQLLMLDVKVDSIDGRGSTFTLTAPRTTPQPQSLKPSQTPQAHMSLNGLTALCIDNDPGVLEAMETALKKWGATVHAFTSDDAAVAQLGDHFSPPDVFLLDYQLDRGRTGFDALKRLEKLWGARPITIMITASSSGEAEKRAAALNIPVLAKPIEPAELRALIEQMRRRAAE
ncbi:MAG: PAS-domain containing protein [Pseudomonadota bacterium]